MCLHSNIVVLHEAGYTDRHLQSCTIKPQRAIKVCMYISSSLLQLSQDRSEEVLAAQECFNGRRSK